MSIQKRRVHRIFTEKFKFQTASGRSKDHKWLELFVPGYGRVYTKVSHGSGEIGKRVMAKMAKQIKVDLNFLKQMI